MKRKQGNVTRDLAPFNLAQAIADPYSIFDLSRDDPRIHAVRRIALAAVALQYDAEATEKMALRTVNTPSRTERAVRSASQLTVADLERVAEELEREVDALVNQ